MRKRALASVIAAVGISSPAAAATIFGVDETNNLVAFNSLAPGTTLSSIQITGANSSLAALDFRSATATLYGLSLDLTVYTIDTATGVATAVGGTQALQGTSFGFDFNPTIDRLRIVSNSNQNYVFNPDTGTTTQFTDVFFAPGDANFGKDPNVTANAYTSAPMGGTTTQYAIDTANDVLVTQANNAGTLATIGSLGTDLGTRTSFDIAGSDAFALDGRNFYSVNLATGALINLGQTDRSLFGIAIAPPPLTAVPEPSTWATMLLGFGLSGLALRRRRRSSRPVLLQRA